MNNLYKVMGLKDGSTIEEIKKQYKNLARKYHPDLCELNQSDCETKMIELNQAYEILSNPTKKEKYDHKGHDDFHKEHKDSKDNDHNYQEGINYYMHHSEDIYLQRDIANGLSLEVADPLTGELFRVPVPTSINIGQNQLRVKSRGFVKNGHRGFLYLIINVVDDRPEQRNLEEEFEQLIDGEESMFKDMFGVLSEHWYYIAGIVFGIFILVLMLLMLL